MVTLRNNRGVTLMEIMVVIAIIGIMGAIAVPNYISWLNNKGLRSAARDLYSNLRKTQIMAIKNNRNCALSLDGVDGYVAYVDENKDCVQDAGEQIIARVSWAQYRNVQFNVSTLDTTSGNPTIGFQPTMIPYDKSGGIANGSVTLKNNSGKEAQVTISQSGNISLDW